MKIFGNYAPQFRNQKPQIDPVAFTQANWPLLCQLVKFERPPFLEVVEGTENRNLERSFPMLYFPDSNTVMVYRKDLQSDFLVAVLGGNAIPFLWGHLVTMARYALRMQGIIPPNEWIDMGTVKTFGWPDAVIQSRFPSQRFASDGSGPETADDNAAIQIAIMGYIINCGANDLSEGRIASILLARKSTIDRTAFRLERKKG